MGAYIAVSALIPFALGLPFVLFVLWDGYWTNYILRKVTEEPAWYLRNPNPLKKRPDITIFYQYERVYYKRAMWLANTLRDWRDAYPAWVASRIVSVDERWEEALWKPKPGVKFYVGKWRPVELAFAYKLMGPLFDLNAYINQREGWFK
jgi:hypothetical protein